MVWALASPEDAFLMVILTSTPSSQSGEEEEALSSPLSLSEALCRQGRVPGFRSTQLHAKRTSQGAESAQWAQRLRSGSAARLWGSVGWQSEPSSSPAPLRQRAERAERAETRTALFFRQRPLTSSSKRPLCSEAASSSKSKAGSTSDATRARCENRALQAPLSRRRKLPRCWS